MSLGRVKIGQSQLLRSSCLSVDVIAPGAGGTQSLNRAWFSIPRMPLAPPPSERLLRVPLLKSNYNC